MKKQDESTKGNLSIELQPLLITIEQAAKLLSLSPQTIYNMVGKKAKKKFPVKCQRIGRKRLFRYRDILSYVDSLDRSNTLDSQSNGQQKEVE
jgi:excisionase family DNA binding protein